MNKNYIKEITIGIVSSTIFLVFVQPLVIIIWDFIKDSSFSTYKYFSSQIIKQAAIGDYNLSDSFIMLGLIIYFIMMFLRILNILNSILNRIGVEKTNKFNPIAKFLIEAPNVNRNNRLKKFKIFVIIYFIFGVSVLLYLSTKIMVSKGLFTEFNQIINIISPKCSEQEIKQLKSDWASMQSYEDFQKINEKIQEVSHTKKIIYPESIYFF